MSSSNCCFLTCIQISQEAGQVVCYSHLLKNFPQFIVIHTVKGFGIVNKAEIDVFLELSRFFDDPADVGNLISGSSVFFKTSLNIWKFTVHILLKPGLENFKHYFTSMWDECNCVVVWAFFGIPFLWDWLALLGLEILVEGLIQSWLLWWSGQGNSTGLCKRTPRKEKEAKSKEKIRVFLRLTDSFSLTNCMCTLVTLGQALGIKTHVYSPPHSPWNLFTNQENRH